MIVWYVLLGIVLAGVLAVDALDRWIQAKAQDVVTKEFERVYPDSDED